MEDPNKLTVTERYKRAIVQFNNYGAEGRADDRNYQEKLLKLIKEFNLIKSIIQNLDLFSENETIDEINTNYIPFLNVEYYIAELLQHCLVNPNSSIPDKIDPFDNKAKNLISSKTFFMHYLQRLRNFNILSNSQASNLDNFKDSFNPTADELMDSSPAQRRADKIENYRLEKELNEKLKVLSNYYNSDDDTTENNSIFSSFDDEIVRNIFIDELRLYSIKAFNALELIEMEIQVLSSKPIEKFQFLPEEPGTKSEDVDKFGYTTKLEILPYKKKNISDLISKQGKILQPFTITSDRSSLKKKVFGTGQVLPSMSVEEYLDYELANGKMMKENKEVYNDSDTEDSEDELENRRWDDWKDDNPKGSGNMKANLG